jgi:Phage integrase family
MQSATLVDTAGRRRSPAALPGYHQGAPPRNKGLRYPADPPTVEEITAVMRAAGGDADAVRLRGLIVMLWRAGLRISEALTLAESDLDSRRGAILVRHGLCRIRHRPCYAGASAMPTWSVMACVCAAQRLLDGCSARHKSRGFRARRGWRGGHRWLGIVRAGFLAVWCGRALAA